MAAPKDITSSKLFQQLDLLVDVDDIEEEEIIHLRSALLKIAERAGIEWGTIRTAFPQYTDHSVQHMVNILDLIYDFLPKKKAGKKEKIQLNALELTLLIAAVLLHDVGMAVTPAEKEAAKNDPQYRQLRSKMNDRVEAAEKARKAGDKVTADAIDDAILVEFFRKKHAALSASYIRKLEASARLMFAEVDLHETLAQIAESHAWSVEHGRGDKAVLHLTQDERFGKVRVNVQFLAFCLRLADILDFDRSRTPQYLFKQINFTEEISIQEWKKHLSVTGWQIQKDKVSYRVACDSPETYVAVQEFLHWVDKELDAFHRAHREWKDDDQVRYALNLAVKVDRDKVSMANKNHMAGDFRFTLDYEKIMNLLMDRSLYPDPAMFLRELLQNSLDACRLQKARAQEENMRDKYRPVIQVYDHTKDPEDPRVIFQDNGVGMSLDKVKNYFLQVGKSFYQSWEFRHEKELLEKKGIYLDACSRFGIGFLSCFLGGDKIEIQTYEYGSEPLKITIYGPDKYFLIEKFPKMEVSDRFNTPPEIDLDEPQRYAGTKVTVFLRKGWREGLNPYKDTSQSLEENDIQKGDVFDLLDFYAVNQEFQINVICNGIQYQIKESRWENDEAEIVFPLLSAREQDQMNNELRSLLLNHEIKLEKYKDEFPGLKGRAWIWLLRNGNKGVPQMEGIEIRNLIEIPDKMFIVNRTATVRLISSLNSFQGKSSLVNWLSGLKWGEDVNALRQSCGYSEWDFHLWDDVIIALNRLKNDERQIIFTLLDSGNTKIFGTRYRDPQYFWIFNARVFALSSQNDCAGLAGYLLSNIDDLRIDVHDVDLELKLRISISGINLPAGIVDWSPLAPNSTVVTNFLPPNVSGKVDITGKLAPIPTPNRLSCTLSSAKEMIETIHRILIREIVSIYEPFQNEVAWRKWFFSYMQFFYRHGVLAIWKEMLKVMKFLVVRHRDSDGVLSEILLANILNEESEFLPVWTSSHEKPGYFLNDLMIPQSEVVEFNGVMGVSLEAWLEKVGFQR